MKVLVTGGTGLIGIHVIDELLRQKKAVRALVRDRSKLAACLKPFERTVDEVEIQTGDVTDESCLDNALAGCDALIHCAGVFSNRLEDAAKLYQINVVGTANILHKATQARLDPIIHISSYLALFPPQGKIMQADDPVSAPRNMYSRTKAAAENIARELQALGKPVVTVYPASVQGPNDPTYGIGSQIIEQAILNRKIMVTDGGRSYTDVRDLAQVLDRALQPGLGPRRLMFSGYYLGHEELRCLLSEVTGVAIKAQKIPGWLLRAMGRAADLVSRLTGKPFQLTAEAAEVLTRSVPCDDEITIRELNLEPIGAEQSFRDLIRWMRQSGKLPRTEL